MEQIAACMKSQRVFSSQLSVSLGDTAYNSPMNLITRYGGGVLHKIWLENWLLSNILKLCDKVRFIGQGHAHGRGHVTPDLTCPKSND